jgi:cellobiose-specific phosphotransferase system component IIC
VRIVNRREPWAKWTAGLLVSGAASIATFIVVGEHLAEHGDITFALLCAMVAGIIAAVVVGIVAVWIFNKLPRG